jgi:F-box protein 21
MVLTMYLRDGEQANSLLMCFAENRRYYATAVLDHVHRSMALAEWSKVATGEKVPLERALGAFDLFVLHDQHGDLLEVCDQVGSMERTLILL